MARAVDVIRKVAPFAKASYLSAFETGDALLQKHEITTPRRLSHFLAQVLHESGALRSERESMSYRAERILQVFGAKHSARVKPAEARRLANNPQALAERVYGLGNPAKAADLGNVHAGDGFRYRGGGMMQTTGRANYREVGKKCGVDFEADPDLIFAPEHALKPALALWTEKKLNAFADADDILSISRAINLGSARSTKQPNGMTDRTDWLRKVRLAVGDRLDFSTAATTEHVAAATGGAVDLSEIQRRLYDMGLYAGEIDGTYNPATETAIKALFLNQAVEGHENWTELRYVIGAGQLLCRIDGIEVGAIDGLLGPQTRYAFEIYELRALNGNRPVPSAENWRDEADAALTEMPAALTEMPAVVPARVARAAKAWPREEGVQAFFGPPGSNQVTLILPFTMRLAWDLDKSIKKVSCNKKVQDHLERIWKQTLDHYGLDEIKRLRLDLFGGCLNVRRKRGGSGWSMHAYGIAWDVDPAHNALKMDRDEATLDGPEYDAFWSFVYGEGAIGLGRERDYDWMHFQFARL